jgi:hypothetical protein
VFDCITQRTRDRKAEASRERTQPWVAGSGDSRAATGASTLNSRDGGNRYVFEGIENVEGAKTMRDIGLGCLN